MRNRLVQLAAAVALLGSAVVANAATAETKHAIGVVTKVDLAKGKIEIVNGNITQRYLIQASTPCVDHGKNVDLASLAPGTQVLVDWSTDYDRGVASRVQVLAAPKAGDGQGSH